MRFWRPAGAAHAPMRQRRKGKRLSRSLPPQTYLWRFRRSRRKQLLCRENRVQLGGDSRPTAEGHFPGCTGGGAGSLSARGGRRFPAGAVLRPARAGTGNRRPSGEDGHVLGSYHTDRESWGTLSPLDGKSVCFNNYEELIFVDTKEWVDTGFVLDFQQPQEPNCRISSLAFDPKQEEYLAIYQVSSYTMSSDGEVAPMDDL